MSSCNQKTTTSALPPSTSGLREDLFDWLFCVHRKDCDWLPAFIAESGLEFGHQIANLLTLET
jgi:hypothetical protein